MRATVAVCLLAVPCLSAHAAGGKAVDRGMRFDSPGVLDLAERTQAAASGAAVAVTELAGADAERIFAAPAVGEDPPLLRFSDDTFGCAAASRRCSLAHEAPLLHADVGFVKRSGGRLTVSPTAGSPLEFIDWKQSATNSADGDEETHWYLGRLSASGYLRVEVQFQRTKETTARLLSEAREDPSTLLSATDRKREPRGFVLSLARPLGTGRGRGERSFVLETRRQVVNFYRDVVGNLREWQARAPRLPDAESTEDSIEDPRLSESPPAALPLVEPATAEPDPADARDGDDPPLAASTVV